MALPTLMMPGVGLQASGVDRSSSRPGGPGRETRRHSTLGGLSFPDFHPQVTGLYSMHACRGRKNSPSDPLSSVRGSAGGGSPPGVGLVTTTAGPGHHPHFRSLPAVVAGRWPPSRHRDGDVRRHIYAPRTTAPGDTDLPLSEAASGRRIVRVASATDATRTPAPSASARRGAPDTVGAPSPRRSRSPGDRCLPTSPPQPDDRGHLGPGAAMRGRRSAGCPPGPR